MKAETRVIGRSVERRPIRVIRFQGDSKGTVCVLAATHGDEPKTVYVVEQLIAHLCASGPTLRCRSVVIIPVVNPDGYARRRRTNACGVDLNRNFPTRDWQASRRRSRYHGGSGPASEPETRAVMRLVERERPCGIVTLHSITDGRFCNNCNGPALALGKRLARHNGYPVNNDIGYPTPGSFGTWAGTERRIPTITLELPSHTSRQRDWRDNEAALIAAIRPS